jgi:hypothetical protein
MVVGALVGARVGVTKTGADVVPRRVGELVCCLVGASVGALDTCIDVGVAETGVDPRRVGELLGALVGASVGAFDDGADVVPAIVVGACVAEIGGNVDPRRVGELVAGLVGANVGAFDDGAGVTAARAPPGVGEVVGWDVGVRVGDVLKIQGVFVGLPVDRDAGA